MSNNQRIILTRIVCGFILAFLLLRFFQQATGSGMMAPPLFMVQLDITYWLYKLLRIPSLIVYNKTGAMLFDGWLLLNAILVMLFPLNRLLMKVFTIAVFLQALTFNSFGLHHTHALGGFMIVLFPFWVRDNERCYLLWQAIRYYACYIYTLSFLWKAVFSDAFMNWQQGAATFRMNLVEYMYNNPDNLLTGFYRWCIREDWFLNIGNIIILIMEGMMAIGFFTKKWDRYLFWFPIFIHIATYFFSDVLFFELLVLDISLLSLQQIETIGKKIPWIAYTRISR
jgi:hypothetical protein